jgi:uncharacterized membrane protein
MKPEKIFAITGAIFGILFLLITPPFQVPDEANHFYRAFQITDLQIIGRNQDNKSGGFMPQSIVTMVTEFSQPRILGNQVKQEPEKIWKFTKSSATEADKKVFIDFPNTVIYSPIPYIPQSIGISIGRILVVPPILLVYLGRIVNLFAWISLVYCAIKITPIHKWLFFLLALTPMSLFQSASLSADAATNGLSFLLIATLLNYAFSPQSQLSNLQIASIFLMTGLISQCKIAYLPLFNLYLILPITKLGNSKVRYWSIFILLILFNLATSGFWGLLIKKLNIPFPEIISPSKQLLFVLSHPIQYLQILGKTIWMNAHTNIEQFIGVLGWLDTGLPNFQINLYLLALLIVSLIGGSMTVKISLKQKIVIFAILTLNFLFIMSLLYLSWNPVGSKSIEGLQGRYLIPLSPLIFLLFNNQKLSFNRTKIANLIVGFSLFSCALTVSALWHRYY